MTKREDTYLADRIANLHYFNPALVMKLVEVDIACENGLNHPIGPFRLNNPTGIDLTMDILQREYDETGKKPVGYDLIKFYYDKGWYGKKTGRGLYEYEKK